MKDLANKDLKVFLVITLCTPLIYPFEPFQSIKFLVKINGKKYCFGIFLDYPILLSNVGVKKICALDISLLPKTYEIMGISLHTLFRVNTSNELTQDEKQFLKFYQLNPKFNSFINNYIKNYEFKNTVKSIVKLSK